MPAPKIRLYRTNKAILIQGFKGGAPLPYPDFQIPAGLRCKAITEGGTAGKFFLDELPKGIFPPGGFLTHDASYYGIVLEPEDVDDVTPMDPDWPSNKPMTAEAIEAFRLEQQAPYATARKNEKLLTLYVHFDGTYSVVYDRVTTYGPTRDVEKAIESFNRQYSQPLEATHA